MSKAEFETKVGQTFSVKIGHEESVDLKLLEIKALQKIEGFKEAREQPFSLIFLGPEEKHLPDNSYLFSVEGWDDMVIFISAHKKDEKGIYYDCVFN